MYSILHITDLHRAKSDPISNAELLSALVSDRERYEREDPPIRPPDAIVVSGDIIQGVPLNEPNFKEELAAQYAVAHDFLLGIVERFLGGDRTKVIIVPGNHDIDWNVAVSSMEPVEAADHPSNLPAALFERNSPFRWDWKAKRLYRITNPQLYRQRLDAFWRFFERFYYGATGMLRVEPGSDANLYSLDDGRIAVAAFNSCEGNDCFSFHGEIPREAIANAHLDLRDLGPWRLRIAVWHHDIEGPPHRGDYMDVEIVRGMIGRGFRLGLYGHQHRVQITPQHAYLLDQETMAIASAGSLCAAHRDLPAGALRGYSIVEINDDYTGARVHVREMRFANLFSRAALRDFEGRSYVDLKWTKPLDAAGRPEDVAGDEHFATVKKAEEAIRLRNNAAEGLGWLFTLDLSRPSYARRLAVEAAASNRDPKQLLEIIGSPQTLEELVFLVDTYIAAGSDQEAAAAVAEHGAELGMPAALQEELRAKIGLTKWAKL